MFGFVWAHTNSQIAELRSIYYLYVNTNEFLFIFEAYYTDDTSLCQYKK